jgi:hypothetical protein
MPTESEILEETGNLIGDINAAFTAREPAQEQLGAAQRQIQMWVNSLQMSVVEVHARMVTEYQYGERPDQEHQQPSEWLGASLVMLVMEVDELQSSMSLPPQLRLRGLKLGPRGSFKWVDVWQRDIEHLQFREDVTNLLEGLDCKKLR